MSIVHILMIISIILTGILIPVELIIKKRRENDINIWLPILLLLISVFTIISFTRFNPDMSYDFNRSINSGGLIGFFLAWYSYSFMGVSIALIPLLLTYTSLGFLLKFRRNYLPALFSLSIMILLPVFIALFSGNKQIIGIYGYILFSFSITFLGKAGIFIIIIFAFIGSLLGLTDFIELIKLGYSKWIKRETENYEPVKEKRKKKKHKKNTNNNEIKQKEKQETKKEVPIRTAFERHIDYSGIIDDEFQSQFLEQLDDPPETKITTDKNFINENIKILEEKLRSFNVDGRVINVNIGPVITTYEFEPSPGIKVSKILSLSDDLAMAMKAKSIRILGHIPGKSAVGIEIPNKKRLFVYFKNLITDKSFLKDTNPTSVVIGCDTENTPVFEHISAMPHLLIAGTTGSGKSVCINTLISSILFRTQPEQVRFLMVDPKRIELTVFNGIPHLERPVITETQEAIIMLKELTEWMNIRYKEFAKINVRNIDEFNKKSNKKKPYIIVIIDEMADLMMTSSKEIEHYVTRLAQMSRAVGIHLVLATQRPSVNIITGSIKANFPIRISFKVPSSADSKTILDTVGADKLLGKGDMLFIPPQRGSAIRVHGAFLKTDEVVNIVNLWAKKYITSLFENIVKNSEKLAELIIENELIQCIVNPSQYPAAEERTEMFVNAYAEELEIEKEYLKNILLNTTYHIPIEESMITENIRAGNLDTENNSNNDKDPLYEAAKDYVVMKGKASTSMLQRHFGVGYPRAARIIEQLEDAGMIGPQNGSKPREVYFENTD